MNKLILLLLPLVLAGQNSSKSADKPVPPRKASGLTVPPDAVQIGPGAWRYVDKDGKIWIYKATLMAIVRMPEADADPKYPGLKVTEKGDTVHFERLGQTGTVAWDRKKSELDEDEKAMLEYARSKAQESKAGEKAPEKK